MIYKTTPEQYFFRFAFPCSYLKLERGEITEIQHSEFRQKFFQNMQLDRSELEKIFAPAFVWIRKLADEMQKDPWDMEVIKRYWQHEHNKIIDSGKGVYEKWPDSLKDMCRVHESVILEKRVLQNNIVFVVEYNFGGKVKTRTVFGNIVPDANKGDSVKIHHSYAIEKV